MQNIITLITCLFLSITSSAQISLEHSYSNTNFIEVTKLEDYGYVYYGIDQNTGDLMIYDANHSLLKDIPITTPTGYNQANYGGGALSQYLFNNDNKIEFIVTWTNYVNNNFTSTTRIIDEDGNVVFEIPSCNGTYIVKVDQAWKLVAYITGANGDLMRNDVYSLSGQYTAGIKAAEGMQQTTTEFFPNPINVFATLRYSLPTGVRKGELNIYNEQGQNVRSYKITNDFNDVKIEKGQLPAGIYTYQIAAPGVVPVTSKFIIE